MSIEQVQGSLDDVTSALCAMPFEHLVDGAGNAVVTGAEYIRRIGRQAALRVDAITQGAAAASDIAETTKANAVALFETTTAPGEPPSAHIANALSDIERIELAGLDLHITWRLGLDGLRQIIAAADHLDGLLKTHRDMVNRSREQARDTALVRDSAVR